TAITALRRIAPIEPDSSPKNRPSLAIAGGGRVVGAAPCRRMRSHRSAPPRRGSRRRDQPWDQLGALPEPLSLGWSWRGDEGSRQEVSRCRPVASTKEAWQWRPVKHRLRTISDQFDGHHERTIRGLL